MTVIYPETPNPGAGQRFKLTLPEFLVARYEEQRATAEDVLHWNQRGMPMVQQIAGGTGLRDMIDPELVLLDLAAKRRIVEASQHHARYDDGALGDHCRANLALLALPYVDHPDYREEWKP